MTHIAGQEKSGRVLTSQCYRYDSAATLNLNCHGRYLVYIQKTVVCLSVSNANHHVQISCNFMRATQVTLSETLPTT